MRVWRISNYADLSGFGGMVAGARWHSAGRPIVYTAEHPALALLETLVHLDRRLMPSHYQLLSIDLPDAAVEFVAANVDLSPDGARRVGDVWLASNSSVALQVPSAVFPYSTSYLINPRHPAIAGVRVERAERWPIDGRLV